MKIENLCLKCPDQIRGLCCNINIPIEGFNIILENVVCPFFNKETKLCSDYKNREEIAPWCLNGKEKFNKGALPKECLYLKGHSERELNPKIKIRDILHRLSQQRQQKLVYIYNILNNIPFEKYAELCFKNKKEIN